MSNTKYENLTEKDVKNVLIFFEKYWSLYGQKDSLRCALIERKAVKNVSSPPTVGENFLEKVANVLNSYYSDFQITYPISPDYFSCVKLPHYDEVYTKDI
jgi:hypothetical protein